MPFVKLCIYFCKKIQDYKKISLDHQVIEMYDLTMWAVKTVIVNIGGACIQTKKYSDGLTP
jgi:hypothetical protein